MEKSCQRQRRRARGAAVVVKALKITRSLLDVNMTSLSSLYSHSLVQTHSFPEDPPIYNTVTPKNLTTKSVRGWVLTKQPGIQGTCESGRQVTMLLLQTANVPLRLSSLLTCRASVTDEVRQVSPAEQRGKFQLDWRRPSSAKNTVPSGYVALCQQEHTLQALTVYTHWGGDKLMSLLLSQAETYPKKSE